MMKPRKVEGGIQRYGVGSEETGETPALKRLQSLLSSSSFCGVPVLPNSFTKLDLVDKNGDGPSLIMLGALTVFGVLDSFLELLAFVVEHVDIFRHVWHNEE